MLPKLDPTCNQPMERSEINLKLETTSMKTTPLQKTYLVISLLFLMLTAVGQTTITGYLKPLLIPFLFFAVIKSEEFPTKKWLLLALLFSWMGDIILIFAEKSELFFIFGLLAFLFAHLLFIVLFINQEAVVKHKQQNYYWLGFGLVLLYLFGMLSILLPKLGSLQIPVGIYAMTISLMLIETIKGYCNWQQKSKVLILIGAIFFVLSDSVLAFNKFYYAFSGASFLIMSTYLLAQFLIVKGVLDINKK